MRASPRSSPHLYCAHAHAHTHTHTQKHTRTPCAETSRPTPQQSQSCRGLPLSRRNRAGLGRTDPRQYQAPHSLVRGLSLPRALSKTRLLLHACTERDIERDRQRERECVCVCEWVCGCVCLLWAGRWPNQCHMHAHARAHAHAHARAYMSCVTTPSRLYRMSLAYLITRHFLLASENLW